MGIFIHLAISTSVTKEEWERVYAETLQLISHFPLADTRKVSIRNIDVVCLTKTEEIEELHGWSKSKKRVGWGTDGTYDDMKGAEYYFLPKDLIGDNEVNSCAGDAMLGAVAWYLGEETDERSSNIYDIWGGKTQGEPYHIYLLAIACLIEDRLRNKAYVYGDITSGQCRKAVEIANEYLDEKIEIPDRCVLERLFKRVQGLEINELEKLKVLEFVYLGNKDQEFGEYVRNQFTDKCCREYWKEEFKGWKIGTIGFDDNFMKYLLLGFELKDLIQYIDFVDENGDLLYEKFILRVMDAKLHLKEKDCRDILAIDQDESRPYTIWTFMAQVAFAGARNKKIDRYIPIDELRGILKESLGGKCDVDAIVNSYLENEEKSGTVKSKENIQNDNNNNVDSNELLNRFMDSQREQIKSLYEEDDIVEPGDLLYYESGDSISSLILDSIKNYFEFYQSLLQEEQLTKLMEGTTHERCEWLVYQNRYFIIRDIDWEKIFDDIETNKESFQRYYSMMRVKADDVKTQSLVKAIVLNDDFYTYLISTQIAD